MNKEQSVGFLGGGGCSPVQMNDLVLILFKQLFIIQKQANTQIITIFFKWWKLHPRNVGSALGTHWL